MSLSIRLPIADCRLGRFSKDHLERPAMRSECNLSSRRFTPIGNWQLAIGNFPSFVPQRYEWINFRCPAAWYVAGDERHNGEQHGDNDERRRVGWFHAKEHARHQSAD